MAAAPTIEEPRSEPGGRRGLAGIPGTLLPWALVFGFAIAAGIAARFLILDRLLFEIWADRDLSRAEELLRRPWFTGAEFDRGGRTPGGFYYLLLRTYLLLGHDPARVHLGTVALDVVALVALGAVTRRHLGWPAGLAVAAFYACSPAVFGQLRIAAYNPTNAMAFGALAHAFFLETLLGGRRAALPVAFLFIALAAQIHFSYALLVLLFVLVLAVQRVRIGARSWALAAAAFVAAYLPYLVADGLAGWPNMREIGERQDVLAAPAAVALVRGAPSAVPPRLDSLATVLLGMSSGVATPWWRVGSLHLYRIGAWRLFPVMMIAGFLIYSAWTWVRRTVPPGSRPTGRAASAALVLIGAGLLLLSVRNTSLVVRYVLFLVPAAALLHGCAFQAYADALVGTRSSWRKTLLNLVLLYWAALCANANTLLWSASLQTPLLTSQRWERLIGDLQREMRFGSRDLLTRVVLVDGSRQPLALLGPTEAAGAYFVRTFADGRTGDPQDRCAFVLIASAQGQPVSVTTVPSALALLPSKPALRDVRTVTTSGDTTIVSYRLESGSCYHNLNDRYVPTPEEQVIAAAAGGGRTYEAVKEIAGGDARRFVVTLGSRNPALGPLRLLVEVGVKDGAVSAMLHSNELRGYDGLSSFRARDTVLVLQAGEREWRVPIYEGTLGGWFTPALTPWRSAPVAVPAGVYRADLAIDDVAFLEYGGSEGARRVPLTEALPVAPPPTPSREASGPGPPDGGPGSRGAPARAGTGTPARAPTSASRAR